MNPTLKQATHFFTLLEQKEVTQERLQEIYQSGLLADLLDMDMSPYGVSRSWFRVSLGLWEQKEVKLYPWKTIKLGLHNSAEGYRQVFAGPEYHVGDNAAKLLPQVTTSPTVVEVSLARVSGYDLGFRDTTLIRTLYRRIADVGAELCPAEVGPALLEQWADYNIDPVSVAMKPLKPTDMGSTGFSIDRTRDEGRCLRSTDVRDSNQFDPKRKLVVVIPK